MKNYVEALSYAEEWEIMKMAIANKDVKLIRTLLKDGYSLTVPLLEGVYRFIDKAALLLIVNSYPDDLEAEEDCVMFLKETLEKQQFDNLMEHNSQKMAKIALEEQQAQEKELVQFFENAEKEYGDSAEFYQLICKHTETFEYAKQKYGEDALFTALERHGLLYCNDGKTQYDTWYLRGFSFEYLMSSNKIDAAAQWLTSAVCIHDIEDYNEAMLKIVNAGGLKYLIVSKGVMGFGRLLEDENIRNEFKKLGAVGYQKLYYHAKNHFTLDDWYKWYEFDKQEALKRCKECKVPKKWLLKHKHFLYALGLK